MSTISTLAINSTDPSGLTFLVIWTMFVLYIIVEFWQDKRRAPAVQKLELENIENIKSEGYDYKVDYLHSGLWKHSFVKDGKSSVFVLEGSVLSSEMLNECLRLAHIQLTQ